VTFTGQQHERKHIAVWSGLNYKGNTSILGNSTQI